MAASKKADKINNTTGIGNRRNQEVQLSARSGRVKRQLHGIGTLISLAMLVATLVLLGMTIYNVYLTNQDFVNGNVTYITLSKINTIVASVLLMMITVLSTLIFFRLYRNKSPFTHGNIFAFRVAAIMLMLLSFLPVTVQNIVGLLMNITVKININFMYVFIGVVFYCFSYILEQGDIIQQQDDEMMNIQEQIILQYAEVVENKSGQESQHVKRISEYSRVLAQNLGMSESEVETVRLAAMMHDIGKILIPTDILQKTSPNDEEFAIMKTHIVAGEELLHEATGEVMQVARHMALDHHEHWDGTGYLGKKAAEISRVGQIISIADMFDSMFGARSYKKGWEMNKVYSTITDESGKRFDPVVVEAFSKSYKEMTEIYNEYSKNITSDYELDEEIVKNYELILGEYSEKYKKAQEAAEEKKEDTYQNVELDLRRLI